MSPPSNGVSLDSPAAPRGGPGKVLDSLRRLHWHRLVELREQVRVIGAGGPIPPVPNRRAGELSASTTRFPVDPEWAGPCPAPIYPPHDEVWGPARVRSITVEL